MYNKHNYSLYIWLNLIQNMKTTGNVPDFDNLSDLQPSFHNRKLNYEYTSFIKPTFLK